MPEAPFPYQGPEDLQVPVVAALRRVVDPEMALNIVDVGLVYGVSVADGCVHLRLTMTSVACPVIDLILEDVETELDRSLPAEWLIQVELVWQPPWSSDRMSASAKQFMGW
jgi:metal-sulfur cluster biosynthetic enzyme